MKILTMLYVEKESYLKNSIYLNNCLNNDAQDLIGLSKGRIKKSKRMRIKVKMMRNKKSKMMRIKILNLKLIKMIILI